MTIEERFKRLERTNRRYRWGIVITITLVAIAEIVATVILIGYYVPDVIRARSFEVVNEEVTPVVRLHADFDGNGAVATSSAKGTTLVELSANEGGDGIVQTSSPNGTRLVELKSTEGGNDGAVVTSSAKGTPLVVLSGDEDGGAFLLNNKTDDTVIHMHADEYGHGYLGVFDRKGKGQVIRPGP